MIYQAAPAAGTNEPMAVSSPQEEFREVLYRLPGLSIGQQALLVSSVEILKFEGVAALLLSNATRKQSHHVAWPQRGKVI